jgi:hypothetical protein
VWLSPFQKNLFCWDVQFKTCENHLQPVLDEEIDGDVLAVCKPFIGETDAPAVPAS